MLPEQDRTVHRSDMGRYYRGLPMHAAGGVHEYALRLVRQNVPLGARVLDIGCGVGALTERLHDAGFSIVASDVDASDYRASPPVIEWDVASPGGGPEGPFDAVIVIEVLEHLENVLAALRNIRALIARDGVLIASTPNLTHPRSRIKYLLRGVPGYFGTDEYHSTGHRTMLPAWLLTRHLESAGFTEIAVSYAGRFDLTGAGKWPYAGLRVALGAIGWMPEPRVDDGAATFVVAR